MFLRLQSQWVIGMTGAVGLNYQSLEFLFRIYGVLNEKELFEDIKEIELGALEAMSRANEKAGAGGT